MGATHWDCSPGLRPRSGGGSQSWVRPQDPQVGLISSSPRSGVSGARKFPRGAGRLSSAQMMDAFLLRLLPPPSGPFTSPPRCGGGRGPSHTLGKSLQGPPCRLGKPETLPCLPTPFLVPICLLREQSWSCRGRTRGVLGPGWAALPSPHAPSPGPPLPQHPSQGPEREPARLGQQQEAPRAGPECHLCLPRL